MLTTIFSFLPFVTPNHFARTLQDILSVAHVKDIACDTTLLACLNWASGRWHKLLFVDTSPRIENRLLRPALFELCVLTEVSKRLQSSDLYIDNSIKCDDYRNHLVSNEVLRAKLDQFCIESDLPCSGSEFSMAMKQALVERAASTDQRFE